MKYIVSFVVVCLFSFGGFSQNSKKIDFPNKKSGLKIVESDYSNLKLVNSISLMKVEKVSTKKGMFAKLLIDGFSSAGEIGYPELPTLNKLIEIPYGAKVKIKLVSFDEQIVSLSDYGFTEKIIPVQPSYTKNIDPTKEEFKYNEAYYNGNEKQIVPEIAQVEVLGFMRGVQVGKLIVSPFQYNPVENSMKILHNIELKITFENANVSYTKQLKSAGCSPFFNNSFAEIINYQSEQTKDTITSYPVKYVIVSDPMFQTALQPFVNWKTKKGFDVIEAYTGTANVGTTKESIKAYLSSLFFSGTASDPSPSFVLLVGDIAQIPTYTGISASHNTDYYYAEYTGDIFPDVYIGRFSANNLTELQPQIDKTLEYEQYLMADPSFLNEVVLIAGVDGSYAATHGNGQINYGTSNYFNAAHGVTSHTYLYGSGSPIVSNSSAASPAIIQNVSNGVGFANYTAHCSASGWADPSFTTSNVSGLQNAGQYPLMIGNCCQSSSFGDYECFGEAVLRAANKGALGYIGASNNSYWNEDFYYGVGVGTVTANPTYAGTGLGAYDRLFHDNGELPSEWFVTQGQINYAGNMAVSQSSSSADLRYWEMYHLFGDPSLTPYLSVPSALNASYPASVPVGTASLTVNTEALAYVAISMNNILLDAKLANTAGVANLSFPAFANVGVAHIVVTKQNRQPFIDSLMIITSNQAFVGFNNFSINDASQNNNSQADFGESIFLNVNLNNIGNVDAINVNAQLSTNDSYITLIDSIANWGNLTASSNSMLNNAFQISIDNDVPNQHNVSFTLNITDANSNQWTASFSMNVNAPQLEIGSITINDSQNGNGNGRLDPGENLTISIETENNGGIASPPALSTLSCSNPSISIVNSSQNIGAVVSSTITSFTVNVSSSAIIGSLADFSFNVNAGNYSCSHLFSETIGIIVEDWEAGNFLSFSWAFAGNSDWTIDNTYQYEGSFSAQSGTISHNQNSELVLDLNVLTNDSISFYKKVSSEANYDYLEFWIDNTKMDEWAGNVDWSFEIFPITAGTHTIKFIYDKDYSVSSGSDCAWVDYIEFPPINYNNSTIADFTATPSICVNNSATITYTGIATGSASFTWDFSGGTILSGSGQGPYEISWNSPGTYDITLSVVDGSNSANSTVSTIVNPLPVVNLGADIVLPQGQFVTLDAGSGFTTYIWNTGAVSQILTVFSSGNYSVTVSDLNACTASDDINVSFSSSPWTFNVTGTNHTVLIPQAASILIDGNPIGLGDYIGVFYDSLGSLACAGYAIWQGATTNISAWGEDIGNDGFVSGESFVWKIYDISENAEYITNATYNITNFPNTGSFVVNGMSGILSLENNTEISQDIQLPFGWSIISTYIDPTNPNVTDVFSNTTSLIILKDEIGLVYWPQYGVNSIGNLTIGKGYQAKVSAASILTVGGTLIVPETTQLNLSLGWNILGYIRQSPGPIVNMLSGISSNISIVKNSIGNVYWPLYGINNIGMMNPGEGYQIKLLNSDTLIYPAN
ncbi:MAG: hypothetical protein HN704_10280 [Bacteroidetes bacterium]|jgi:hypothetical protein|nr:hypothetical protein [Bacteroidota bacterium]MBT6687544.1 hypothetical protein [Bacteroidota bacterium]MBT7142775.1 hypothetical protein [Bacteroidota bacterium]MBT7491978.1 hypothetical protein [Bacteroidota bacterium]